MVNFHSIKDRLLLIANPRTYSTIYYKIIILGVLLFIWFEYRQFGDTIMFFENILKIMIYYIVLSLFFNYARLFTIFLYQKRNHLPSDHYDNLVLGINRTAFFLNHFIFILVLIQLLVIDIRDLLTSLSLVAVAIVLIFKENISNFLSGISIMFSKNYNLKDYIKMGDTKGRITNISFQNVELKTESGDFVYIPNSMLMSKEVANLSKGSLKNIKIDFTLPKSCFGKYLEFKKLISDKISKEFQDSISSDTSVIVRLDKVEKEGMQSSVEVLLSRYSYKIEDKIKNFVNEFVIDFVHKNTKEDAKKDESKKKKK